MPKVNKQSTKGSNKTKNDDHCFLPETSRGKLLVVLDFSSKAMANIGLVVQRRIEEFVTWLDQSPGMRTEDFLGYLGREINNVAYEQGRGSLLCVAAICLLEGRRLSYLTYGDARINLFTEGKLVLLNGSKFITPTVIQSTQDTPDPINENPEQMGRQFFERPLSSRVSSLTVKDGDVVLMFSDGLEQGYTPQQRLGELKRIGSSDPEAILKALFEATRSAQDDRTLIVICGPYDEEADLALTPVKSDINNLQSELKQIKGDLSTKSTSIHGMQSGIDRISNKLDDQVARLNTKAEQSGLESLKTQVSSLELLVRNMENKPKGSSVVEEKNEKAQIPPKKETSETTRTFEPVNPSAQPSGYFIEFGNSGNEVLIRKDKIQGEYWAYATLWHPQDLTKKADLEIKSYHRFKTFDDAWDYIKKNRKFSRRIWDFLGVYRCSGAPGLIRLIAFLLLVVLAFFLYRSTGQPNSQLNHDSWKLGVKGRQVTISHFVNDGFRSALTLELGRELPEAVQDKPFNKFEDLQDYLKDQLSNRSTSTNNTRQDDPSRPTVVAEMMVDVPVLEGDSLGKIAKRHNADSQKIMQLNPGVNWSRLKLGQTIRVPKLMEPQ